MSAGVAVCFKKRFGKPQQSDCINEFLTYQKRNQGASVMAWLLSRQNILTYQPYKTDKAFQQLTLDFNEKRLERLICSRIGCIWDVVPIHNFLQNLIEFQDTTNANL